MKVQHTFTVEILGPVEIDDIVFTLCDTEAENTNSDKMDAEPIHTLCWYLSLCNMSTFIQQFFVGLCARLGIGQCEHTITGRTEG